MIERLRKSLDDENVAIGLFVDLQKAFDTFDYEILCQKLNYGIRDIANKWFSSYLKVFANSLFQSVRPTEIISQFVMVFLKVLF